MAAKTGGRTRKSKSEIQNEFEQIKEEVSQASSSLNPKSEELSKMREAEVRDAVRDLSASAVVQKLANMGIEVSKTLSELSAKLVEQTELLNSVREAVELEKKELSRLHKVDVAKTALDQLIEEFELKNKSLEEEMSTKRAEWEREQEIKNEEAKELDESLKKLRTREKEEYEYQKTTERKKEQDKYVEDHRLLERQNKEKQESLEKNWAERESQIKSKEEEFNKLKKEVETFPERLKQEVIKAVTEATQKLELKQKQDLLVAQKDVEAEKRLSELKVKSLEETVTRQFTQIEILQARLEEAKKQVQDIAVKAIEGASGARALSHVNQIAMEQAKTRSPQV